VIATLGPQAAVAIAAQIVPELGRRNEAEALKSFDWLYGG